MCRWVLMAGRAARARPGWFRRGEPRIVRDNVRAGRCGESAGCGRSALGPGPASNPMTRLAGFAGASSNIYTYDEANRLTSWGQRQHHGGLHL
jgi:hypothetical protein